MKTEDIEISFKLPIEELHEIANMMIQQMIWEARMRGSYSFEGLELVEEILDTLYENPPNVRSKVEYQIQDFYENNPDEENNNQTYNSSYIDIENIIDLEMGRIFKEEKK